MQEGGSQLVSYDTTDFRRTAGNSAACELPFYIEGEGVFSPQVDISFVDGSTQSINEFFEVERDKPSIDFGSVAINGIDGEQNLLITINASDNVDIAYLSLDVIGLRASSLRKYNGVIERARSEAYAESDKDIRIYPKTDQQTEFKRAFLLSTRLPEKAIANDALVLVEAIVVMPQVIEVPFPK